VATPTACKDGYVKDNQCVSTCGVGYYGTATYDVKYKVSTSVCQACPAGCYECSDASKCLSCKKGFYLQHASRDVSYGTCVEKTVGTFSDTIYVDFPYTSSVPD